jgi:hypothetical protein
MRRLATCLAALALWASLAAAEAPVAAPPDGDYPPARPFRWTAALAFGSEGFGGGQPYSPGERLSLILLADPFMLDALDPSLGLGFSLPAFPWKPEEALVEARLDLRLFTLREKSLETLYGGRFLYAPALTASLYLPFSGGQGLGSVGLRPFAFRTGDAVYSFLAVSALLSPGSGGVAGLVGAGFSVELFDFTHFFL